MSFREKKSKKALLSKQSKKKSLKVGSSRVFCLGDLLAVGEGFFVSLFVFRCLVFCFFVSFFCLGSVWFCFVCYFVFGFFLVGVKFL